MSKIAKGNFDAAYNSNNLESYVDKYKLKAGIQSLDTTDMGATSGEAIAGIPVWSLMLEGDWSPTLDGYLGPDAISPPSTLRSLSVTIQTVTYSWTSPNTEHGAFVGEYETFADSARSKQRWRAVIVCAGAPSRSTL